MWIIKTETVYTSTVPPYQDTDKWVKFEAPKGEKGDAFAYSDFTTAQLDGLKGPKGDTGIGLKNKGEWVVNQIYEPGDYVFDQSDATSTNNVMWISKLETILRLHYHHIKIQINGLNLSTTWIYWCKRR